MIAITEGVMVAKKDYNAPKHLELDVKNLHVIKACQSLTSRGFVSVVFSWQYYYYILTPEGIDYLREFLHLPAEVRSPLSLSFTFISLFCDIMRDKGG
jgi:small subunit ribosomal protein S10e